MCIMLQKNIFNNNKKVNLLNIHQLYLCLDNIIK